MHSSFQSVLFKGDFYFPFLQWNFISFAIICQYQAEFLIEYGHTKKAHKLIIKSGRRIVRNNIDFNNAQAYNNGL